MSSISMAPTAIRSDAFLITPSDANNLPDVAVGIIVGNTAGNIRLVTEAGTELTIPVSAHQFLQLQVRKVFATGTTATTLHGLR